MVESGYGERPSAGREEGPSLLELFTLLRRRPGLVLGIAILVGISGALFLGTRTPSYRAAATILVAGAGPSGGVLGELASLSAPPAATSEMALLRSRTLAERVAREDVLSLAGALMDLGDPGDPDAPDAPGAHGMPTRSVGLTTTADNLALLPLAQLARRFTGEPASRGRLTVRSELVPGTLEQVPNQLVVEHVATGRIAIGLPGILPFTRTDVVEADHVPGIPIEYRGLRLYLGFDEGTEGQRFIVRRVARETATKGLMGATRVVEVERNSGVIEVSVTDSDPHRAATSVNALVENYLDQNVARGRRRASQTLAFIDEQLEEQRVALEQAYGDVVRMQAERPDTIDLSLSARALVERQSSHELERMQLALSRAAINEAAQLLEQGDPAALAHVPGDALLDAMTRGYVEELVTLDASAAVLEQAFTEDYPPLLQNRAAAEQLRGRIRLQLESRQRALAERDAGLADEVAQLAAELGRLPERERAVADPKRRFETHQEIYRFLSTSREEARLSHASTLASAEVIDHAVPPTERVSPRLGVGFVLSGLLGLALGLGAAFLAERVRSAIFSQAELEEALGMPIVASVPDFRVGALRARRPTARFLAMRDDPEGAVAEAYRALRAGLRFLHDRDGGPIRTLAVTSTAPGEGKSTTNLDLAWAMAAAGQRVLVVDADMRRPSVHRYLDIPRSQGLSDVLADGVDWRSCVHTVTTGLTVLPAGSARKATGDLLMRPRLVELLAEFRGAYDLVVYDLPPALAVADVATFAHELDALLLLYRAGGLPRRAVQDAGRRLERAGANVVGAVLNAVRPTRSESKRYGYGYYGDKEEAA